MPPVELYCGENHYKIKEGQSAKVSFLTGGIKDERFSICIEGTKNGGDIVVRDQAQEDNFTLEPGQMNKKHLYKKTPVVLIGTSS